MSGYPNEETSPETHIWSRRRENVLELWTTAFKEKQLAFVAMYITSVERISITVRPYRRHGLLQKQRCRKHKDI
jgi:hypothetical protein